MATKIRLVVIVAIAFFTALASALALALEQPKGKVILTVSGKIGEKNAPESANFDVDMLAKLPQQEFTTQTPWAKAPIRFTGPLLRDVLASVKASGTALKAFALNDYQTVIPMSDTTKFDMIVAYKMDGELIPVRTKGPLFVVYPYDSQAELRSATYYERSAWQLKSLTVE
jgi:hypothetical protein